MAFLAIDADLQGSVEFHDSYVLAFIYSRKRVEEIHVIKTLVGRRIDGEIALGQILEKMGPLTRLYPVVAYG